MKKPKVKVASGVLPIAADTKNICLAWRSPEVKDGNRFGTIGGGVKPGMTVKEGVISELGEEVGFYGPIELHPAFVHRVPGFRYHSFVGIVHEAFLFDPEEDHAWETSYITWEPYHRILEMMHETPERFHHGLLTLFRESKDLIERFAVPGLSIRDVQ